MIIGAALLNAIPTVTPFVPIWRSASRMPHRVCVYDATQLSNADGTLVGSVAGLGGIGPTLTAAGGARPTMSTINGAKALSFDANDHLITTDPILDGISNFTIVWVGYPTVAANTQGFFGFGDSNIAFYDDAGIGTIILGGHVEMVGGPLVSGAVAVWIATHDPMRSPPWILKINGVDQGLAPNNGTFDDPSGQFTWGALDDANFAPMTGKSGLLVASSIVEDDGVCAQIVSDAETLWNFF